MKLKMFQSNQEEESDDGTSKLEITETLNNEPEVVDDEYEVESRSFSAMDEISESHTTHGYEEKSHLVTAMDEISESHTSHENALQNDIKWGHGILMKFLTKLRLV